MAKILIINPVVREEDDPKHIPYGLALLASIAIKHGHLVQVYDENAWRKGDETVARICQADEWDVIAIGGLTTTYRSIKKILKICEENAPEALIIAGGGFFTCMPLEMMQWLPQIDLGIIGEGFVTWPEVLKKIDQGDFDFSKTLGVCYRDRKGGALLTDVRPNIKDLDTLPYPAWDLLPLEIYFQNSSLSLSEAAFNSKRRMDVMGSLGCNLVCKFCWHLGTTGDMVVEKTPEGTKDVRFTYGRNIRYFSPRYIVDMVKTMVKTYQIDFVYFIDENFMTMNAASGRTWLKELCALWIKEGLQPTARRDGLPDEENQGGVFWCGTSHAGLAYKEVLDLMYEAGCASLVYGTESFDPGILKSLGKGVNQKQNIQALKTCLDSGIIPIPNIMIGFPEESFQSVRTTIEWMIKLGIHSKPHFATPYPGSEWYYTYKESIIAQYYGDLEAFVSDLGDAMKITAVISHKFSPVQLLGLQQIVLQRDLRLLDLAEQHWGDADALTKPLVQPKASFHMVNKKVKAPLEAEEWPNEVE